MANQSKTYRGSIYTAQDEQALMSELWDPQIVNSPFNFVMFAFPWGKKGTALENFKGPRTWQRDIMEEMADHIQMNILRMKGGKDPILFKLSRGSGRGIGKSALCSWLNLWAMSCVIGGSCTTTANTEFQLKKRTWAEMGKWLGLAINSHWWDKSVMSFRPARWYEKALKDDLKLDTGYYESNAQLWSKENPDAFAGLHNSSGNFLFFDEASGIPEEIWKVSEGFFTEPILHRYWIVFSNPRRNTGAFYNTQKKQPKLWRAKLIDSRTVEGVDRGVMEGIIKEYGADSDEAKVEVYGQFPDVGENQLIPRSVVAMAEDRALPNPADVSAPLIMGVDPARGGDKTVIRFRKGRDARSIRPVEMDVRDNMAIVDMVLDLMEKYEPDAIAIDAGAGTGIIDRLRELGIKVNEVWFGAKSRSKLWENKRTEMWVAMREWMRGGCIDKNEVLRDDLLGPELQRKGDQDKQRLESKDDMKKRGLKSPDHGDALALTFAVRVPRKDTGLSSGAVAKRIKRKAHGVVTDIFGGIGSNIFGGK